MKGQTQPEDRISAPNRHGQLVTGSNRGQTIIDETTALYHHGKFQTSWDLKLLEEVLRTPSPEAGADARASGRIGYQAREYARAVLSKTTAQVK
jgi:hypothetical protein